MPEANDRMDNPAIAFQTIERIATAFETNTITGSNAVAAGGSPMGFPGASVDLARVAETSIARLLGGPINGDASSVLQRLAQVFPSRTDESGSTKYQYRPMGAQPLLGSSGSAVRGAQAAFFRQASVLGASVSGLLDTVEPLVVDPDEREIASLIALMRDTTNTIVSEYSREGGAILPRIDVQVGQLQRVLEELSRELGVTDPDVDDELSMQLVERDLILANMAMLKERISDFQSLQADYADSVINGIGALYGRLAWLIRAVPPAVDEVLAEFNALNCEASERMLKNLGPENAPVSLEQVLTFWCRDAAAFTWVQRLEQGRRTDIKLIASEAAEILKLLRSLEGDGIDRLNLVGTLRLAVSLRELLKLLEEVADKAERLTEARAGQREKKHHRQTKSGSRTSGGQRESTRQETDRQTTSG
ncbi:hypothetical protein [Microvirga arabica]|uniref:hypothetical protein n=1 Tax=Microvirga arabica TaxID=1128671 RepID=UPI00193A4F97|nr:hypothetical protein [Microvirga arabica]MBM1174032.1 hypothetical protein [Microvirga arabica]